MCIMVKAFLIETVLAKQLITIGLLKNGQHQERKAWIEKFYCWVFISSGV